MEARATAGRPLTRSRKATIVFFDALQAVQFECGDISPRPKAVRWSEWSLGYPHENVPEGRGYSRRVSVQSERFGFSETTVMDSSEWNLNREPILRLITSIRKGVVSPTPPHLTHAFTQTLTPRPLRPPTAVPLRPLLYSFTLPPKRKTPESEDSGVLGN